MVKEAPDDYQRRDMLVIMWKELVSLESTKDPKAARAATTEMLAVRAEGARRKGATRAELVAYATDLLSCSIEDLRDPKAAVICLQKADKLTKGKDVEVLELLSQACEAANKWPEAIAAGKKALALMRSQPKPDFDRYTTLQERIERLSARLRKRKRENKKKD